MQKNELLHAISIETGLPKRDIDTTLNALSKVVVDHVNLGQTVRVSKLGTFSKTHNPERQGRNIYTKEPFTIPESYSIRFQPAADARKKLNSNLD